MPWFPFGLENREKPENERAFASQGKSGNFDQIGKVYQKFTQNTGKGGKFDTGNQITGKSQGNLSITKSGNHGSNRTERLPKRAGNFLCRMLIVP